jgi:Fur family peroxide stress response transcriptional regulator
MKSKYRRSRQREALLKILQQADNHPTASWIYDRLKSGFPRLSLGTVYRNLLILTEQGLIRKIDCGSTFDRYEANSRPHYHFICEQCNAIYNLTTPVMRHPEKRLPGLEQFRIHSHMMEFFGLCPHCQSGSA